MLLLRIASSPPRLRGGGEEVKKIFFSKGEGGRAASALLRCGRSEVPCLIPGGVSLLPSSISFYATQGGDT